MHEGWWLWQQDAPFFFQMGQDKNCWNTSLQIMLLQTFILMLYEPLCFLSAPHCMKHLARQAPSWVVGQVFYCLYLIFITKLHSVHITAKLEFVISSTERLQPHNCKILHHSACKEAGKQHLLFYFHRSSYSPARWYHFVLEWPETNIVLLLCEIPEGINGFL